MVVKLERMCDTVAGARFCEACLFHVLPCYFFFVCRLSDRLARRLTYCKAIYREIWPDLPFSSKVLLGQEANRGGRVCGSAVLTPL